MLSLAALPRGFHSQAADKHHHTEMIKRKRSARTNSPKFEQALFPSI
jgi:hypothetical protein